MRRTYAEIKAEIAKLEQEALSVFETEVAGVIARIKEAIQFYNLSAEDLGLANGTKRPTPVVGDAATRARMAASGVAKYRDPETGKTWTGRGKPPA